jgi:uncharacterized protein YjbI with pentapeptide repeats
VIKTPFFAPLPAKAPIHYIKGQDTSQLTTIRTDAQAGLTVIDRRQTHLEKSNQYLDLSLINLHEANLVGANLDRVKLNNSILTKANLRQAHLNFANLSNANLDGANLSKADLSGEDLYQVNLAGTNLNKTDLRKIKNLNITQIKQAQNWILAIYDPEIDRFKS